MDFYQENKANFRSVKLDCENSWHELREHDNYDRRRLTEELDDQFAQVSVMQLSASA